MDVTRGTSGTVALAVGLVSLILTARVSAHPHDYFVVDTQFRPGTSAVVDASGVFAACTQVEDLDATASAYGAIRFTGERQMSCDGARVVIQYDVAFDPGTGRTAGTWRVAASTLPGIQDGDRGLLIGDPGGCMVAVHADGCILDRLTLADWPRGARSPRALGSPRDAP